MLGFRIRGSSSTAGARAESVRRRKSHSPTPLLAAGPLAGRPRGKNSDKMKRLRLDELLVERGLAESRAQAKALIMSGRVMRGTERLEKPGKDFPIDTELTVEQPPRFVSRGGEKLIAAIQHFSLNLAGAHVLDV